MSDNKNATDGRDAAKVDKNDPSEVEQVHRSFPNYTHAQIVEAIEKHGPMRQDIYNYLKKGK